MRALESPVVGQRVEQHQGVLHQILQDLGMEQHGASKGDHVLWSGTRTRRRHQLEDGAIGEMVVDDGFGSERFLQLETEALPPRRRQRIIVQPALDPVVLDHAGGFNKTGSDAPAVFPVVPVMFTCMI